MSIYSVNILSVCLSVMLQKALLLMDVFIIVFMWNIQISYLEFIAMGVNASPEFEKNLGDGTMTGRCRFH